MQCSECKKEIQCDLCGKIFCCNSKATMKNTITKSKIDICEECFNEFFSKSDSEK